MNEVFGPKKKPRDSPAPGPPSLTHSLPTDPRRRQRYIGLCPNKSEATALPSYRAHRQSSISSRRRRGQCGANVRTARMIPANFTGGVARVVALARLTFMHSQFGEPQDDFLGATDPRAGRQCGVSPFGLRLMARQCGKIIEAGGVREEMRANPDRDWREG
jgi:hypothetical protein